MTCRRCGGEALTLELTPDGPHYGKLTCNACGRFVGWAPTPRQALEVGKQALHFGETVTVLWLKNGWAGLEGADGRKFSRPQVDVRGMPS